jgi:Cu/Ag efflux protein CusF
MKTNRPKSWMAVYAAVLTATVAFRASADQPAMTASPDKNYTGTIASVNLEDHTINVKNWLFGEKFNLGANCTYMVLDGSTGVINDLAPGDKVAVSYESVNGVLVADRVNVQPIRCEGEVVSIDPTAHTMTVHSRGSDKTFIVAEACNVVLRDNKPGTLANIQTGDHVAVTFETPNDKPMAEAISQTSIEFEGTLTAVDLGDKTLKVKSLFGEKTFNVGDDCVIMANGNPSGQLSDLKLNDKIVCNYDEVNGVNVANRIAPAEAQSSTVAVNPGT